MTEILDQIEQMLVENGQDLYGGEAVTQTEHALQCAFLAEQTNANAALITASLLHDIGHFLEPEFELSLEKGQDMQHEQLGEKFLEKWFEEEVTEPVKLHVAAKRYLCATNENYFEKLSPASVLSLKLQGGPMSDEEIAGFEQFKFYKQALRLRVWDDLAKDPQFKTPPVTHFMQYVHQSLIENNEISDRNQI